MYAVVSLMHCGRASTEFVRRHGIYYLRHVAGAMLLAERPGPGACPASPRLYLLDYSDALRLLDGEALQAHYGLPNLEPHALDRLCLDELVDAPDPGRRGRLVYQRRTEELPLRGLLPEAFRAVLERGVPAATGRWWAHTLVESIFFGVMEAIEFTPQGAVLGPQVQGTTAETLRRQLRQLEAAGVLRLTTRPGTGAYCLQLNPACLPGLPVELLPRFSHCFLYPSAACSSNANTA